MEEDKKQTNESPQTPSPLDDDRALPLIAVGLL